MSAGGVGGISGVTLVAMRFRFFMMRCRLVGCRFWVLMFWVLMFGVSVRFSCDVCVLDGVVSVSSVGLFFWMSVWLFSIISSFISVFMSAGGVGGISGVTLVAMRFRFFMMRCRLVGCRFWVLMFWVLMFWVLMFWMLMFLVAMWWWSFTLVVVRFRNNLVGVDRIGQDQSDEENC